MKNKKFLNNIEDFNYNIIKSLGYSPFDVINHNDLRKPFIEWKYGTFNYKSFGLAFLSNIKLELIKEFIDNLKDGYTYAVIPILITLPNSEWGSKIISLNSQNLLTNKTNINKMDAWLTQVHAINYLKYGKIINEGSLILRYRIISLSQNIFDKISNKELLLNSNVPLKNDANKFGIEKIHLSNDLYPNSIDLNNYGILITKYYEYNNKIGNLYQYKPKIQILIINIKNNNNTLKRDVYVFKNKKKK